MKFLFLISCLLIAPLLLNGQSISFNEEDSLFFERKLPRYEKWLNSHGYGALLKVYEIDPDSNMVTLVLTSSMPDADSTLSAWITMKENHAAIHRDSLEEGLFNRFCEVMEVPKDMAVIEVYNKILDGVPCFYRGIYFDKGRLQTLERSCMNQKSMISIGDFELRSDITVINSNLDNVSPELLIKKNLEKELRSLFYEHFVNERKAKLDFLPSSESLIKCEVTDIKREILEDEANPALADFLNLFGLNLDWVKREFLTIKIIYEIKEDQNNFTIDVNGKYGSGIHQPRRNAYIEMEPEFESYVARYAGVLADKIRQYLRD